MEGFADSFGALADPRASNRRHNLLEVLYIALAATLCGAESCADMADFGRAKEPLLRRVLDLPHGIPSHDTFSRLFRILDPSAFAAAFAAFVANFATQRGLESKLVAVDGKALRGAFERGRKTTPLHLVNVWASDVGLALAQRKAPGRNEVAGTLEVLKLVALQGCIVTADALHCHRDMAQALLHQKADYVLALKENQSALYRDGLAALQQATDPDRGEEDLRLSHGRWEARRATVVSGAGLAEKHKFPGIAAVARLEARRSLGEQPGGEETTKVRYFLLSRQIPADQLLRVVRAHWSIENQLHWVLDVVFDEDRARNRKDNGPENLAIVRKLALNILRSHPEKASIRRKIKRAGWDDKFLCSLIGHMR